MSNLKSIITENKKTLLIAAASVAALALLGLAIDKKSKKKKFEKATSQAKSNFRSKLNELQRKAKKEYQNSDSEVKNVVNAAKDRATEWVNRANS